MHTCMKLVWILVVVVLFVVLFICHSLHEIIDENDNVKVD